MEGGGRWKVVVEGGGRWNAGGQRGGDELEEMGWGRGQ